MERATISDVNRAVNLYESLRYRLTMIDQAIILIDMRSTDLNLNELLSYPPEGGVIRFGPLRIILMDTSALGLLRKELIDGLSWSGARMLFYRLGFAQGWRAAETLHHDLPWDSD